MLPPTFLSAMVLNQGTQFLMGKISFVSNSVTSILQLALSLDYAVILCNRYKEEREHLPIRGSGHYGPQQRHYGGSSSLTTSGGGGHDVHAVQNRPGYGHLPDQSRACRRPCF